MSSDQPAVRETAGSSDDKPDARSPRRFGMVVGIRPDKIEHYKRLHADGHPGVRDLLTKYHLRNFSIFLH